MKNVFSKKNAKTILLFLLVALIAIIGVMAAVPPVSRDALTHHLVMPRLYLEHGGIYEIPAIIFSYYPMNLDLMYMVPLYYGNDIIPKFIHFMFALLTAGLIYYYLHRRIGRMWALCGALFFLSLPIIVKLSITVYVDLGLVFFSTAALVCLLKWIETRFQCRWLVFSAISCGLALGTKYNGLIVLFLLTVFVPFIYVTQKKRNHAVEDKTGARRSINVQLKSIGFGALFCCIALLVFSPWMIRNYVWKSNPVYPLYNSWFQPSTTHRASSLQGAAQQKIAGRQDSALKKKSIRWSPLAIRKVIYQESWWEIMLIPVRIFFQGQDDNPKYFDGKLNPFLFLLALFAFWPSKNDAAAVRTEKRVLMFFAVLYLFYALSKSTIRIRYIAPIIPPLVMLSMFGLKKMADIIGGMRIGRADKLSTGLVISTAAAMLAVNAFYIYQQFNYVQPLSYISGQVSRDEYIIRYRPEYPLFQYANQHLPADARILAIFLGNRGYYSHRQMVFGNALFKKLAQKSRSADRLSQALKQRGFSHVIVRYDLFNRWSAVQFNDSQKETIMRWFKKHAELVYSKGGYGLFKLF